MKDVVCFLLHSCTYREIKTFYSQCVIYILGTCYTSATAHA